MSMVETIDAHHHLWRYCVAEYDWIPSEMEKLRRDFLPEHLRCEMAGAGVDGAVVVQARQSVQETRWLIECAEANDFIRGVVGWVPLVGGDAASVLREFAGAKKLKGIRHVVQAETAGFLLREDFNAGVSTLLGTGLVYDILIHAGQMQEAAEFVRRHPEQVFVLDHVAKPRIRLGEIEPWRSNLFALAEAGNVYCKISGTVTEADWDAWSLDGLRPYLDTALEAFGPGRLMVGSDWPVCLVASEYGQWWDVVRTWLRGVSIEERDGILGETAKRVYGI